MDKQFYRTLLLLINDKKVMGDIQSYVNASTFEGKRFVDIFLFNISISVC